jgi:hypothetical protein
MPGPMPTLLTFVINNQEPGRSLTLQITNQAVWSLASRGRQAGFQLSTPDGSPLQLANLALSETTISLGGGAAAGNMRMSLYVVPAPTGMIEGVLDTGGDAMVSVAYMTSDGLHGMLGPDWTIAF